jgi:hypothetical protein
VATPSSASFVLSLALWFPVQAAWAFLAGDYRLILEDDRGERLPLGEVRFRPAASGFAYRIDWDETRFENHFLSMRPFKCLRHPRRMICRLPYPYALQRRITETDLTDLEYDLLFLHRAPGEYGINAWNGLYFRLHLDGERLIGELGETDLNVLQAPPPEGVTRPIDPQQIYPAAESLWPRRLLFEPRPSEAGS